MADIITIEECIKRLDAIRHEIVSNSRDHFALSAGIAALYEMENDTPAVSRWIPCSERLPVLYDPVIILTDDGSYAIAHVTGNEDEYLWFGDGGHYSKDYVLFWMPLPEPPKEDET